MTYVQTAKRVFNDEIRSLEHLKDQLDDSFDAACELLFHCRGKVVVSGMGKSGHIGNKIAATLASTGTSSFFMHPGEANHGDLGMVSDGDVLVAISNSGETSELIALLPVIKRLNVPIIAITNRSSSNLAKLSDVVLDINVSSEACSLGLAPTSSTTATLVLGDALAISLLEKKGFTSNDFALSHPGGSLGKRLLLTVDDIMSEGNALPIVDQNVTIADALIEMSQKGLGMTGVVDDNGHLIGVFTDGDLRRTLDKRMDVASEPVANAMTSDCITIESGELAVSALAVMQKNKINALFVMSKQDCPPVGALKMHDLLKAGVI